jgi:lipopolysaccharide/colanic/teichoic acid biosynthesis glycosyltransferase
LRATDETGWLDSHHIGVLMPHTPGWGAWTVADEICLEFPDVVPLPECTVYCYPSDWFVSERGRLGRFENEQVEQGSTEAMEPFFFQPLPLWKRALDVLVSASLLLVLSPLLAAVALLIKLTSRGPALFAQRRSGLGGRPFVIYKFRTMVPDAEVQKQSLREFSEQDGPAFKMAKDPRVTPLGKFLRKSSIDELPQLWNVLKGDMSLVGPRPLPCDEAEGCTRWQRGRLDVTPGITCIWQVYGRSRVTFEEWVRMDVRYVQSRSFWKDLRLILETIPAVLFHRGAV